MADAEDALKEILAQHERAQKVVFNLTMENEKAEAQLKELVAAVEEFKFESLQSDAAARKAALGEAAVTVKLKESEEQRAELLQKLVAAETQLKDMKDALEPLIKLSLAPPRSSDPTPADSAEKEPLYIPFNMEEGDNDWNAGDDWDEQDFTPDVEPPMKRSGILFQRIAEKIGISSFAAWLALTAASSLSAMGFVLASLASNGPLLATFLVLTTTPIAVWWFFASTTKDILKRFGTGEGEDEEKVTAPAQDDSADADVEKQLDALFGSEEPDGGDAKGAS